MQTMMPITKRVLRKMAIEWVKAEGKAEGIAEGMTKANLKTARSMLAKDMPMELIKEFTGLSLKELKTLR